MGKKSELESVWDYPRPPRLEEVSQHLSVSHAGKTIASTNESVRVLETSHPPTYYLAITGFAPGVLIESPGETYCEFKGVASYFDLLVDGRVIPRAAWTYKKPNQGFEKLLGKIAIYASKVDECFVGEELVQSQEGDFYGGWITANIKGPFKGAQGTMGW
jgi:uncharacterized protein (DUF427 family)